MLVQESAWWKEDRTGLKHLWRANLNLWKDTSSFQPSFRLGQILAELHTQCCFLQDWQRFILRNLACFHSEALSQLFGQIAFRSKDLFQLCKKMKNYCYARWDFTTKLKYWNQLCKFWVYIIKMNRLFKGIFLLYILFLNKYLFHHICIRQWEKELRKTQ